MDDEEKLDKIMEMMGEFKVSINDLKGTLTNHMNNTDKEISRLQKAVDEAKDARTVIHKKMDDLDVRTRGVETDPMFAEWRALKGKALGTVWVALGIIALAVILNALPNIQKLVQG